MMRSVTMRCRPSSAFGALKLEAGQRTFWPDRGSPLLLTENAKIDDAYDQHQARNNPSRNQTDHPNDFHIGRSS